MRIRIPEVESSSELIRDEPVEEEKKPDVSWEKMISIRTYENREETELARGFLEANGIRAAVFGAGLSAYGSSLGPGRLMVFQRDAEKALELLNEIDERQ